MKIFLIILSIFASFPAYALTCKNDYAGSNGCAANSTAAGDCQTLGFTTGDTTNCEHYLYCPFNLSYKRCVSLKASDAMCTSGSLDPICESGFAPFQIGATSDDQMCLECQAATCSAANSSYKSASEYFASDQFPLFTVYNPEIVKNPTEKQYATCYSNCNSGITLKEISSANCAIGDAVIWVFGSNKHYCTTNTVTPSSSCASTRYLGVVAYKSGSDIWAVKVTGLTALAGSNSWPKDKKCHTLYDNAKKSDDYSYNTSILLGKTSSSFASSGCALYAGVLGSMDSSSAYGSQLYGFPDKNMLSNIAKNLKKVNNTLKAIKWDEIPLGYGCTEKLVWYDDGFTINYNNGSTSSDLAYSYTGMMSDGYFQTCSMPTAINRNAASGIMVMNISKP